MKGFGLVRRLLVIGIGFSAILALVVTVIELINNPGEVFRQNGVWRWDHVIETAWSWFFPVAFVTSFGALLFIGGLRFLHKRRSNNS